MFEKCVLTILELNWNQRLGHKKTKLNICHHRLTSSTQLQNRSFDVVERTRTSSKCQKLKNARAKRAKLLFFIVKYANLSGFCCRRRRGCLSSLLPVGDDWYLNLNSQKRPPGRNLGEHRLVRRSGATSRGTVVLVFCLRMRNFPRTEVPTIFMGRNICVGSTKT